MRVLKGAHTKYSIYYHFVFCVKYRRQVLTKPVEQKLKEIIRELATFYGWLIEEINGDSDHIHIFLSAPPRYAPAKIANLTKSWSRRLIFKSFPKLKQKLWGASFWSDGYFVTTVNDKTTKQQIKKYIKNQKKKQKQLSLWNKER